MSVAVLYSVTHQKIKKKIGDQIISRLRYKLFPRIYVNHDQEAIFPFFFLSELPSYFIWLKV